jgi:hypothetical protein
VLFRAAAPQADRAVGGDMPGKTEMRLRCRRVASRQRAGQRAGQGASGAIAITGADVDQAMAAGSVVAARTCTHLGAWPQEPLPPPHRQLVTS